MVLGLGQYNILDRIQCSLLRRYSAPAHRGQESLSLFSCYLRRPTHHSRITAQLLDYFGEYFLMVDRLFMKFPKFRSYLGIRNQRECLFVELLSAFLDGEKFAENMVQSFNVDLGIGKKILNHLTHLRH